MISGLVSLTLLRCPQYAEVHYHITPSAYLYTYFIMQLSVLSGQLSPKGNRFFTGSTLFSNEK